MSAADCGVQEAGRYDRYRFFACLPCLGKWMVSFNKSNRSQVFILPCQISRAEANENVTVTVDATGLYGYGCGSFERST